MNAAELLGLPPAPPDTVAGLREESLAAAKLLVERLPESPEAYGQLAFAYQQLGQDQKSLESWREALAKDDEFATAHLAIAGLLKEFGKNDEAVEPYLNAIKLDPGLQRAYLELTEVLLQLGREQDALPIAREGVKRFPKVPESHFWLGQTYAQMGDYAEARSSHEQAIAVNPDFSPAYHPLAVACARLGERDDALRYRKRHGELTSTELQADRDRTRNYDDLAAERRTLVTRHVLAGSLYLQFSEPRMAEAHWLRAAAIDPDDSATRVALVAIYRKQARAAAELQFIKDLMRLEPDNPEHPLRKGKLLVDRTSWPDAIETLETALEKWPSLAEAHLLLAVAHLRSRGNMSIAESHALEATRLAASSHAFLVLAAIRQDRGDKDGALLALKQAHSMDPKNPQIQQAYEQLRATD